MVCKTMPLRELALLGCLWVAFACHAGPLDGPLGATGAFDLANPQDRLAVPLPQAHPLTDLTTVATQTGNPLEPTGPPPVFDPRPRLSLGQTFSEDFVNFAAGLGEGTTFIQADRQVDRSGRPFRIGKLVGRANTTALVGSLLAGVKPAFVARFGWYRGRGGGLSMNVGVVNRSLAPRHKRRLLMWDLKGWSSHFHVYGTNAHIPTSHVAGAAVAATIPASTSHRPPRANTFTLGRPPSELEVTLDHSRKMCVSYEGPQGDLPVDTATYVDNLLGTVP